MRRPTWKFTLGKLDRYGRKQVRTVKLTIDVLDFKDRPGFALLLIAANPDLSSRDIQACCRKLGSNRASAWLDQSSSLVVSRQGQTRMQAER